SPVTSSNEKPSCSKLTSATFSNSIKALLLDAARSSALPPILTTVTLDFRLLSPFLCYPIHGSTASRVRPHSIFVWGISLATHGFAHRINAIRSSPAPFRRLRHHPH